MKSIYIMESNGKYKIGISDNPRKRYKQLRTGNCDIKLVYVSKMIDNPYEIESLLHNKYTNYALNNEWFENIQVDKIKASIECFIQERGRLEKVEKCKSVVEKPGILSEMEKQCEKISNEIEQLKIENANLESYLLSVLGVERDNIFTDLIYKAVFGKDAKHLREDYGLTKKDNLRDWFSAEELSAVQALEMIVSGLINCGWGYDQIKDFVLQQNLRLLAA